MTTTTETVVAGQQAESKTFPPLTRTDFVKYQGASGDFHPLHHDDTFARETGFPSVVLRRHASGRHAGQLRHRLAGCREPASVQDSIRRQGLAR